MSIRKPTPGTDVYDLSDEDRHSLFAERRRKQRRLTVQSAGLDEQTAVDTMIKGNGRTHFVTSL